jgi:zinc transport system substrate-binding protein
MRIAVLWVLVATALWAGGCGERPGGRAAGPMRVVISIAPLTGLARATTPPDALVRTLVPPGRSLHGYEMTPADLASLGQADMVVYVGLGLDPQVETFLKKHPNPAREEVCFAEVLGLRAEPEVEHHAHGEDEDDHAHGVDPHLWLDPSLVERLIPALCRAVERAEARIGGFSEAEKSRLAEVEVKLTADVRAMDEEYRVRLGRFKGASIVTHHNAFGRPAERYGFRVAAVIRPIESEEPTPGQVAAAVDAVRKEGARAIFVEPQFSAAAAEQIAAQAGVRVGRLDPEGKSDWFELMRSNLAELERLLASGPE